MNKVLVTGASGFVGTHLIEELSARGIQTTALYLSASKDNTSLNSSISWAKCDLLTDNISHFFEGVDVVFHLAGYSGLGTDQDTISRLNEINVRATERVAHEALRAGSRLIYVSSVHACEEALEGRIIREETGRPVSEYGHSKRRAENLLISLGDKGLDFTILRPTQLFGEYHEGSVFELVKAIQHRRFFIIGDGANLTNFYYVKDFIEVLLRVAENPLCKNELYIAADEPLQLRLLVKEISTNLGVEISNFKIPRQLGIAVGSICDVLQALWGVKLPLSKQRVLAMTRDVQYSNKKLVDVDGGVTPYGIKLGIARTIRWYQSAGLLKRPL